MEIYEYEKNIEGYIKWLRDLSKTEPELAREIARKSLIERDILDKECPNNKPVINYSNSRFNKPKQKIRKLKK